MFVRAENAKVTIAPKDDRKIDGDLLSSIIVCFGVVSVSLYASRSLCLASISVDEFRANEI